MSMSLLVLGIEDSDLFGSDNSGVLPDENIFTPYKSIQFPLPASFRLKFWRFRSNVGLVSTSVGHSRGQKCLFISMEAHAGGVS